MSKAPRGGYNSADFWPFPTLVGLEINQRANFPHRVLRRSVEVRGSRKPNRPSDVSRSPNSLREIHVRTHTKISKKNLQWFGKRLHAFTWSSLEGVAEADMNSVKIHVIPTQNA
ncbi:hypothetical protein SCP_0301530 [Sparassis crispa]|uniref:Uncharacterized protein n=1 Tax=Sparassis crispa TaxID=139825 RepID=A0A401GE28_9APHY|nr:hypothetical protein SCP_0301530 [Sparassis crispa]GBE80438.1 hypothetical protein SCP_0301530 [Sparassis crispa]